MQHFLALGEGEDGIDLGTFTEIEWSFLGQIHSVLKKFDEFTLFVSAKSPRINIVLPIYYELDDLLEEASSLSGMFEHLHPDISGAVGKGLKKYQKYYKLMDLSDSYYAACILDPRFKGELIESEIADGAGADIVQRVRTNLHIRYPPRNRRPESEDSEYNAKPLGTDIQSRLFSRLRPVTELLSSASDIDRYFDSPRVAPVDTQDPNWLQRWWSNHRDEFPQMAAAARDFLAIPASEVSVGSHAHRIFGSGNTNVEVDPTEKENTEEGNLKPETHQYCSLSRFYLAGYSRG